MSGFLYYWPERLPPSVEQLAVAGFTCPKLAGLPGGQCEGPDGKTGMMFALRTNHHPESREPAIGYQAEKQTWMKAENGKWWLGLVDDQRPRPVDLQRSPIIEGRAVQLADGNTWQIPVVRNHDGTPAVETVIGLAPDGSLVLNQPAPSYTALWSGIQTVLATLRGQPPGLTDEQLVDLIAAAMRLNYRVNKWELGLLGVITTKNMSAVFNVLVDADA